MRCRAPNIHQKARPLDSNATKAHSSEIEFSAFGFERLDMSGDFARRCTAGRDHFVHDLVVFFHSDCLRDYKAGLVFLKTMKAGLI